MRRWLGWGAAHKPGHPRAARQAAGLPAGAAQQRRARPSRPAPHNPTARPLTQPRFSASSLSRSPMMAQRMLAPASTTSTRPAPSSFSAARTPGLPSAQRTVVARPWNRVMPPKSLQRGCVYAVARLAGGLVGAQEGAHCACAQSSLLLSRGLPVLPVAARAARPLPNPPSGRCMQRRLARAVQGPCSPLHPPPRTHLKMGAMIAMFVSLTVSTEWWKRSHRSAVPARAESKPVGHLRRAGTG